MSRAACFCIEVWALIAARALSDAFYPSDSYCTSVCQPGGMLLGWCWHSNNEKKKKNKSKQQWKIPFHTFTCLRNGAGQLVQANKRRTVGHKMWCQNGNSCELIWMTKQQKSCSGYYSYKRERNDMERSSKLCSASFISLVKVTSYVNTIKREKWRIMACLTEGKMVVMS